MWQHLKESAIPVKLIPGKVITEFPEDQDDQFEILTLENDTVIAYHCNGKNVLLAFGYAELLSEKWWMRV